MKNRKTVISFDISKYAWILFILYLLVLIVCGAFGFRGSFTLIRNTRGWIQQNRLDGFPNLELVPFHTILYALERSSSRSDLFKSILGYIPAGILIPVLLLPYQYNRLREIAKTLFFSFIIIVSVESIQYFSMCGVFNVDDIILGMAGALGGYIIYLIGRKIGTRFFHARQE